MTKLALPDHPFAFLKSILVRIKKSKLVATTLFCTIGQGLYVLLPGLLGVLIDKIFIHDVWSVQWLILFPGIWLVAIFFNAFGVFSISNTTQEVRKISKEIIFKHIIHLPNKVYSGRDAGEVEHLMHELSFSSRYFFNESLPFFIRTIITLVVSLFIISYSSVELIFVFLGWTCLYIPISYFSAKKSVKYVSEGLLCSANVSASTVDIIENHELIPAFGTENFEINRFEKILEKERVAYNKSQFKIDVTAFLQKILQISLPVSIAVFLISSYKFARMTAGSIASIFSFTLILTNQIGDFGRGLLSTMEVNERIKTALDKLKCPKQLNVENTDANIEPTSWDIRFENVSFSYDKSRSNLKSINLEIKENEKIGIVGCSGSGKTTLIKLLSGFHIPDSGHVFIGGTALKNVSRKSLAQNISEVSQSIPLFHRSIRENVAYGCPASDKDIWEALYRAQIADYVNRLPDGLDTVVGVKGQKLSGGEKARIAIARALIRNSKIIIFDEAMASLDSESELAIQKGLNELIEERTFIAIAHRLSTLRKLKKILILDKGEIMAIGSHEELLNQNAIYCRLWNAQDLFFDDIPKKIQNMST